MDDMRLALLLLLAAFLAPVSAADAPAPSFVVERFVVSGDNPLDVAATDAALAPFLGEHVGIDGLNAARDALRSALRQAGHSFLDVILPPQTLEGGVVQLELVHVELDAIDIRGNQHFSTASVRRSLPALVPGAEPRVRRLSRDLAVANQHPAKQIKLNFRASETRADAVDAAVEVVDQRPWALFTGLNNIGSKSTGYTRLAVGGQYSDVTGHDDIFTGSFTTSPDNADDVQQYGAFYQLPLYALHGWLTAFYVKSDVDVGNVQDLFDISGSGDFIGINFRYDLIGVGRYHHSITAGLQDHLYDTAIGYALTGQQLAASSTKVRSRPLSLRYDGGYNWAMTSLDFYAELVQNLSFGGNNRKIDYRKVRDHSASDWTALRFGALVTQRLPHGFLGVGRVTGQYADEPLLPGEQIGFGGDRSVRGFEQRTISGDKGVQFNFEVWTPAIERLYGVRFLAFFDAAHKVLEKPGVGQRPNDTISSVGVGARWQWHDQLAASIDYGQPLASADGEASDHGNSKVHFNLEYRY